MKSYVDFRYPIDPYVSLQYEGPKRINSVSEFCKKLNLEYIGRVFNREDRFEASFGELIKINDLLYIGRSISYKKINDKIVQSVLECIAPPSGFNIKFFLTEDNFDMIIILNDERPPIRFAFKKHELENAKKKFINSDIDVIINGKKITKEAFMAMSESDF